MVRRICSKRHIKESWTCQNAECGKRLRISDGDLLIKVTLLMNRIIENSELLIPKPKIRPVDSPTVARIQSEIETELTRDHPSEEYIVSKVSTQIDQLNKRIEAIRESESNDGQLQERLAEIQNRKLQVQVGHLLVEML